MGLISAKNHVGRQRLKGKPSLAAKQITTFKPVGVEPVNSSADGFRTDAGRRKGGDQQKLHTRRHEKRVPKTLDLRSGCFP